MPSGGNADVKKINGHAEKILRNTSKKSIERFKQEVEILKSIKGQYTNIVEILEYDLDCEKPWYRMKWYEKKDSTSIVTETKKM